MTITTHEQPPRLGRGKHETLNLVMAAVMVQGTVGVLFSVFSTRCQQNVER